MFTDPISNPPVVVVSNRGPIQLDRQGTRQRAAGGLVTALTPVLERGMGDWVFAARPQHVARLSSAQDELGYHCHPVAVSKQLEQGYYDAVANAVLWPVMHSFQPTVRAHDARWEDYVAVNDLFAHAATAAGREGQRAIWVHDYQLMLVPEGIRRRSPAAKIGWFCHIPWPSLDQFRVLPWRAQLLEGLLGADLIGFHTERYAKDYLECVAALTDHVVDHQQCTIDVGGREVRVGTHPIGISTSDMDKMAGDPSLQAQAKRIQSLVGRRKILLGVDRLDYTKGIVERLLAYEQLLDRNPQMSAEAVLVQIMVPSREDVRAYAELKSQVDQLVGRINGKHALTGRAAVHYRYTSLEPRSLVAHYLAADVALVTPLRDGMNLVAHEYLTCRRARGGVLVLSELAGVADYVSEALLVNPYDVDSISAAIERGLNMPLPEQKKRMQVMADEVKGLDVHRWAARYLRELCDERSSSGCFPSPNPIHQTTLYTGKEQTWDTSPNDSTMAFSSAQ